MGSTVQYSGATQQAARAQAQSPRPQPANVVVSGSGGRQPAVNYAVPDRTRTGMPNGTSRPDRPDLMGAVRAGYISSSAAKWGRICDAAQVLSFITGINDPNAPITVYHRSNDPFTKGPVTRLSPWKSGGYFGQGLYTSRDPNERGYGAWCLDISIRLGDFRGKKAYVMSYSKDTGSDVPPDADVVIVDNTYGMQGGPERGYWVIFKPPSDQWLNSVKRVDRFVQK